MIDFIMTAYKQIKKSIYPVVIVSKAFAYDGINNELTECPASLFKSKPKRKGSMPLTCSFYY